MKEENKYLSKIEEEDDFNVDTLVTEVINTRYDHREPMPPKPEYLIQIGGKGIALPGSIIGVYGPPKSRKSSFMGMVAAACLSPEGEFGNITSTIKGSILWFDTEQSSIEVKYFQDNVISMSKADDDDYIYERYHCMKLRPYDELERLAIIDRIITAPNIYNDVGVIILDGVGDLLYNVNEIEASKKLVTRLTYWADRLQVPLFVALHTNKDGKDATGSLGGFLNKKSSYTIKCEPEFDGGPTTVKPYHTRNGQNFRPFMISNDEETGLPKFFDGENEQIELGFLNKPFSKRSQADDEVADILAAL
jgi:hypothetical protein